MRIVGGRFRGRPLVAPKGHGTRPTSDRVREALFNILAHGSDEFSLDGARVLDLFAGTGALGLEAISRGAAYCLFVEDNTDARGAIRENVEALGLTGVTKLWRRDARTLGPPGTISPFHLMFADPPYGRGFGETAMTCAGQQGWLDVGAVCVLEEMAEAEIALPPMFTLFDTRIFGTTKLQFLRYTPKLS